MYVNVILVVHNGMYAFEPFFLLYSLYFVLTSYGIYKLSLTSLVILTSVSSFDVGYSLTRSNLV